MIWYDMICDVCVTCVTCVTFPYASSCVVCLGHNCPGMSSWGTSVKWSQQVSTTVPAQWKVKGWNVATLTSLRTLFTAQRCLAARFVHDFFNFFLPKTWKQQCWYCTFLVTNVYTLNAAVSLQSCPQDPCSFMFVNIRCCPQHSVLNFYRSQSAKIYA